MNCKKSRKYGYKSRMSSVHVTAIDQNFLLNNKGDMSLLGNINGMKFT